MSADAAGSIGRLTIDLGAIVANWRAMRDKASAANVAAVVKADAYGLGAKKVGAALAAAGCADFFTADPLEGAALREAAKTARIFIFSGYRRSEAALFREAGLVPVLNTPGQIDDFLRDRERVGAAWRPALHIDTGMNRLGLSAGEFAALLDDARRVRDLDPVVLMSHFACADDPEHPKNAEQIALFGEAARHFPGAEKSLANSAGVFLGKRAHFDLVRPGIALYGGEAVNHVANPMRPVVTVEAPVLQIKRAFAGETVGYGAASRLERDTTIAICAAGYADGIHRAASGAGTPLRAAGIASAGSGRIGSRVVPILGRVSMDLTAFDVTDIPPRQLKTLEWITIIGKDNPVDDLARAAGTIGYEILTSLGNRYRRVYRTAPQSEKQ